MATHTDPAQVAQQATQSATTVGIVSGIVLAVLGAVTGPRFDVLAQLNGFPRIPIGEGALTSGGIIALVVAVLVALIGAVLGGMAGMRFHRKVDQVGTDHQAGPNG